MAVPFPQGKNQNGGGTVTPSQRVGSSELFSSNGERCEPAKSAKPERPHPSHFAFLFLFERLPLGIPVIIAIIKKKKNGKSVLNVRSIVSRPHFVPLGHKHASAETCEWAPEREARWPGRGRPSLSLTRSVLARVRCSPLEEVACSMLSHPIAWKWRSGDG